MSDTTAPAEPVADGADDAAAYARVVYPLQETKPVPAIIGAICEIMNAIDAIKKGKTSDHGNFKFRGIDDVMNVLGPLLRAHCVFISPELVSCTRERYTANKGGGLMNTMVEVKYVFTSAADGSTHTVGPIPGEGMDTGDKSSTKAMSVAMRTMLLQVFAIPTEDRDPDHDVYEVAAPGREDTAGRAPRSSAPSQRKPKPADDPWADDDPTAVKYYADAIAASGNEGSLQVVWEDIKAKCADGTISRKDGQHLSNLTTRHLEALRREGPPTAPDNDGEFHAA
jgi:hypothetical protein